MLAACSQSGGHGENQQKSFYSIFERMRQYPELSLWSPGIRELIAIFAR